MNKEELIAFLQWLHDNGAEYAEATLCCFWLDRDDDNGFLTSEEIVDLYIAEKGKDG